jgi:hypothetical protein
MDLWEYCDLLRRRYSKNPAALGCAMRQTAKAVMSCGVLALQHLQAHVSGGGGHRGGVVGVASGVLHSGV